MGGMELSAIRGDGPVLYLSARVAAIAGDHESPAATQKGRLFGRPRGRDSGRTMRVGAAAQKGRLKEHHRKQTFQEEYIEFLRRGGVE